MWPDPYIFWYVYMIWYGYVLYCPELCGCDSVMGLVRSHSVTFCHNIPHIMRQCHHVPRLCDSMRQQHHHPCRHMLAPIPRRTHIMNDTLTDIMGCAMLTVLFVALVALCWDYCYKSFSLYIENLNQNVVRNACHILSQSLKQLREQYKYIYYRREYPCTIIAVTHRPKSHVAQHGQDWQTYHWLYRSSLCSLYSMVVSLPSMFGGIWRKGPRLIINKLLTFHYSNRENLTHPVTYIMCYDKPATKPTMTGRPPSPLGTRMHVPLYATVLWQRLSTFSYTLKKLQIWVITVWVVH